MLLVSKSNLTSNYTTYKQQHFSVCIFGDKEEFSVDFINQIYNNIQKSNFNFMQNIEIEYIAVFEDESFIYVITDNFGLIKKYYTVHDGEFYLGSYWDLAGVKSKNVQFNFKSAFEQINFGRTFDNKTLIDDINITNSNQIIRFCKNTKKFTVTKYIKSSYFTNALQDTNDIVENFEQSIEKQKSYIKRNTNSNNILISLSGGLDSRIILPYLKDKDLNIKTFHIGSRKSFLKTYDEYLVSKLLKNENTSFDLLNPFDTDIEKKVNIDILRNPTINSNILKAIDIEKYSIFGGESTYVTGCQGGAVGGRLLDSELKDVTNSDSLKEYINKKFQKRVPNIFLWGNKVNKNYKPEFREIDRLLNAEENYLNIFMDFHLNRHTNVGVFESLLGQIDFYSIYVPYIWLDSKTWGFENLKNRKILIEKLKKLNDKYYKTPFQNSRTIHNSSSISLTIQQLIRKARGSSVDYDIWWKNKIFQEFLFDTLHTQSNFYDHFNKKEILNLFNENKFTQFRENILKLKLIFEFIDSKNYLTLIDDFKVTDKF